MTRGPGIAVITKTGEIGRSTRHTGAPVVTWVEGAGVGRYPAVLAPPPLGTLTLVASDLVDTHPVNTTRGRQTLVHS